MINLKLYVCGTDYSTDARRYEHAVHTRPKDVAN